MFPPKASKPCLHMVPLHPHLKGSEPRPAPSHCNYSFGSCQPRRLFPDFYPPNRMGNNFLPLRGFPHTGPGCYMTDSYGLAYNLTKIPTSTKGYTLGARTAMRFKPVNKESTLHPVKYQRVENWKEKTKQSFVPFNVFMPRFQSYSKDNFPGYYEQLFYIESQILCMEKYQFRVSMLLSSKMGCACSSRQQTSGKNVLCVSFPKG
uniref:Uncharacterized protein n=1 Tax=Spermophilus dauricus TaxID=99837 RepID=A0A8C9Q1A5_SPEDA